MKNLEMLFDEAIEIVKECIGEDKIEFIYRPITVNTRAKKRWGMCTSSPDGRHRIQISSKLLSEDVSYEATMNTIIHEILHACKKGQCHTGLWKVYANMINAGYPQFNIKRTTSYEEKGMERPQVERRYAVKCSRCGYMHYGQRFTNIFKYPESYSHKTCGGKFIREF